MNGRDDRRVLLLSGLLVLAGCTATPLLESPTDTGPEDAPAMRLDDATVTGLHFATSSLFPENPAPTNVDVTLTNPTPSRTIYEATLALPAFPPGPVRCPNDPGYRHTITFMHEQVEVVTATLNSGGCRELNISGSPPGRRTDDAYWTLLARNLDVEESTLHR